MVYRRTEKVEARQAQLRQTLLNSALQLVAEGGFGALTIVELAQRAGIATGTVYKYFDSKAQLCAEVFTLGTEKELARVREKALAEGPASQRLLNAVESFAVRAIRGRRLAYALIAEPVDPQVDTQRLKYRQAYAQIFQQLVEDGIRRGEFPPQEAAVSAAALVGVIAEALVGPLTWPLDGSDAVIDQPRLIEAIQTFCLRAVAGSNAPAGAPRPGQRMP
ncbi:TetR family transcriptional regulator [Marinobacterium nitratireducens]|uniref:TetR family transcriptional regulator n=1 Tax=Marinobacterium nitratireducens TaxID=518897 RepID=A0A917ZGI8_9GAMM|nr:TetR/AcrR family transcriptional regulator [Marinobacterium nitratireducens]GGO81639.1 TetR family transcriptional regulator [Marinobacterium nitratireducens]